MSQFSWMSTNVFPHHLQNGDGRPTGYFCQHAWRVIIPSCCVVSLRRRQQPEETGLKSDSLLEKWVTSDQRCFFFPNVRCIQLQTENFPPSPTSSAPVWPILFFSIHRTDGILTNMDTTFPTSPSPLVKRYIFVWLHSGVFYINKMSTISASGVCITIFLHVNKSKHWFVFVLFLKSLLFELKCLIAEHSLSVTDSFKIW